MVEKFCPIKIKELKDVIVAANSQNSPLEIIGEGSKRTLGRPVKADHVLDMSKMSGIKLYEPDELVLTAHAGTSLAEIEVQLSAQNQCLMFEPMDYGVLLGKHEGQGTIGGMIGCNLSGPRRLKAGSARDYVLGFEGVTGRGDIVKSGGRVVKNVTGYDLSKAVSGAYGTLAVLSEITLKTLPTAECEKSLVIRGLDDGAATKAMSIAMGSSNEVSSAGHAPYMIAQRFLNGDVGNDAMTVLRLEGIEVSVNYRIERLKNLLKQFGEMQVFEQAQSIHFWREMRDVTPFAHRDQPQGREAMVWRMSVAPTKGHEIIMQLRQQLPIEALYDWQGGLVWLSVDAGVDIKDQEALIRQYVAQNTGGQVMLIRAPEIARELLPVFEPEVEPLAQLSNRLKHSFDPNGVLNHGRMVEGR